MSEDKKLENENLENIKDVSEKVEEKVQPEGTEDNTEEIEVKKPEILEPIEDSGDELKEQLSVIKEVREELANAYKSAKEQNANMEQLQKEIEKLKSEKDNAIKTIEKLSTELDVFKTREVEAENKAYVKRLEKLSSDFRQLGQNKSIEQLSNLPKSVISEFESITSAALKQKSEEQLDSVTMPSQSMGEKRMEEKREPIQKKDFSFEGLCGQLTKKQTENGSSSKRTINM